MSDGLLRQRRNLIIVCILLWMMKSGGVTFSKLSFVGFDIAFKNPDVVIQLIWLAFAYFFFRYYQYFATDGINKIQDTLTRAYDQRCNPIIRQLVNDESQNGIDKCNNTLYEYSVLRKNHWIFNYYPKTGFKDQSIDIKITRWKLKKGILLAWIDTFFRNTVGTDYLLPFFFAFFILYYCGSYDWDGSFFRFFFE